MSRHFGFSTSTRRRTRSSGAVEDQATQSKEHWSKLGANLDLFRINGKFCDVEIVVEDETYKAHKLILASASPFFEGQFGGSWCNSNGETVVTLKEMSSDVFGPLLTFVYRGELDIKEENVQDLLAGSNFLGIHEAVALCCSFLRNKLSPSNAIGVFLLADTYNCSALKLESKRYVEQHFPEVIAGEEFYELPVELLQTFLRSEGLSIYNEFQVLEATIKWLEKKPDERLPHLTALFGCIRLPLISIKQISTLMDKCTNQELKIKAQQYVDEYCLEISRLSIERKNLLAAGSSSSALEFQNSYHDVRSQPRMCCRKSVFVVGGNNQSGNFFNDSRTLFTVERLDYGKRQWKTLPPLSHPRACLGLTQLKGTIYAIGGENDSMILDSVESFDPIDAEWAAKCSLRMPRSCLGVCALDEALYAFGGWIGLEVDSGIERYDPVTNKWEIIEDKLPHKMFAMGVVSYEGLIYVIGGFDERNQALNTAYSYNPVTKQFKQLRSMRQRRGYFGIAILHNFIYCVGGTSGMGSCLREVERFSIHENCWTDIAPMKTARISPSVAAVNDQLLAIGGKASANQWTMPYTLDTVEIYEPERNRWHAGPQMPTSRCDSAAIVF